MRITDSRVVSAEPLEASRICFEETWSANPATGNVCNAISDKVSIGQANRVVLNLDDSQRSADEIADVLRKCGGSWRLRWVGPSARTARSFGTV
jgi:hypothetical protein